MSIDTMMSSTNPHFGSSSPKHVAHFGYNSDDNDSIVDYGYGEDAQPDYGYGDTNSNKSLYSEDAPVDYGYQSGDNNSVDYGYGDQEEIAPVPLPSPTRMPRRSSLKSGTSGALRRSSISYKGEINVTLPDRRTVRRRVSIGFSDDNKVKEVLPLTSAVDKEELWVNREQEGINKEKAHVVAEYARRFNAQQLARRGVHVRGLERQMNPQSVRAIVKTGQDTVLSQQEDQRSRGIFCDAELGEKYAAATAMSVEKAKQLAMADYDNVKEDHEVIRRMMRRASM